MSYIDDTYAPNYSICVVGNACSGKTQFMKTLAKTASISRVKIVFYTKWSREIDADYIFTDLADVMDLNY